MMKTKKLNSKEIIRSLSENNEKLKDLSVNKIGLFGSYSKNEVKNESDIDFLVEFKSPTFDNLMDLYFLLEDIYDKKIDLVTKDGLSPYIKPLIENEIIWYETR